MSRHNSIAARIKSVLFSRLGLYGLGAVIVTLGFVWTFQFVEPAPKSRLTIAAGAKTGAYYSYALRYKALLEKQGLKVDVLQTNGSVDNLRRLTKTDSGVDLAFVQGGINPHTPVLRSLGSMYYEPLWVLYRADLDIDRLPQLAGRKVAIGQPGSGTQALARTLLDRNGVTGDNATLLSLSGQEAAKRLLAQEIDVMFMVASPNAPLLKQLLSADRIRIMSFSRANAYTRVFPYLSVVTLPRGAISLKADIPAGDVSLLATTANLVAKKDLHPALINLVLQAAVQVHHKHELFAHAGQFPTPKYTSIALNPEARRFYKKGPPFLQRYLPFWLASMVDRLKIMLLPLIGLLLPFFKVFPPLYRWRVRRKIYRWYSELREVDPQLVAIRKEDVKKHLQKLDSIEEEVTRVSVPLSYADEVYNLRLHIDIVRRALADHGKAEI